MSIQIGNVRTVKGTKQRGHVDVVTMADGGELRLPIHIVAGNKPGPTLCLTAALHGDETDSIVVVREIVQKVDPDELAGTIIAAPVCNPPGLESLTYHTTMDGMNPEYHVFPGDMGGTITQKMAHVIATEIVNPDVIDVLVDVHSTPRSFPVEMDYLYISPGTGEIGRRNEELSLLEDYSVLYRGSADRWPGSLVGHATDQGIPNCYSAGKVRDIENVMKHLKMIPGDPILPERQFITQDPRAELRPTHGGLIYPEFSLEEYPDQIVPEGTVLGRVISPYTFEEMEQLVAPYEAAVFLWGVGKRRYNPGDYAYLVASMEDAEWVRG